MGTRAGLSLAQSGHGAAGRAGAAIRWRPPGIGSGNFVFRYGEHFYNFDGLRRYKAKFNPVWESKYLASPGGLALPRVLLDISVLISGGVKELFAK